jgi:hypothetical protein
MEEKDGVRKKRESNLFTGRKRERKGEMRKKKSEEIFLKKHMATPLCSHFLLIFPLSHCHQPSHRHSQQLMVASISSAPDSLPH